MPAPQPLLRLLLSQPELLATHAAAYGSLLAEEGGRWMAPWQRRWRLSLVGGVALVVGVLLTGQALMLWAVLQPQQVLAQVALGAVPLLPCSVAAWSLWQAARVRRPAQEPPPWSGLRSELAVDLALWRTHFAAAAPAPANPAPP